ncbi:MAG TPA: PmoA family protein [Verrucomicrobiae bacterium]
MNTKNTQRHQNSPVEPAAPSLSRQEEGHSQEFSARTSRSHHRRVAPHFESHPGERFELTGALGSGDNSGMKMVCALGLIFSGVTILADFAVRVESGEKEYQNAIVRARVANEQLPAYGSLASAKASVVFQRSGRNEIIFVIPNLPRQSVQRFTYSKSSQEPRGDAASADLLEGKITLTVGEKKVLVYQGQESALPRPEIKPEFARGGYIHPVFGPSGRQITDDYPANHVHHHGIWFPWTKTTFEGRDVDFWNMGQKKGKVEFVKFAERWSGPVMAGFQAEHRFVDLTPATPKAALNESWTVSTYNLSGAKFFVFDLVSTQTCATASPLVLPKYYYGGLGFRGNWAWNGAQKTFFLTSNGETDRKTGNETRGNWCHMSGDVDGTRTGIAILSHPENFRSPQPMRLHPTEPFFCFAPSQLGDWSIEPGKPYVSKYRFVVSDGEPDKAQIDALWEAYANPPKVWVEKL